MKRILFHQLSGAIFPIILGFLITRFIFQDSSIQYANAYSLALAMLPIASIFEFGQDHKLITNVSLKRSLFQSITFSELLMCLFYNFILLLFLGYVIYSLYMQVQEHFLFPMINYSTAVFLIISIAIARLLGLCESLLKAFNQYKQAAITRNIFPFVSSVLILILCATKAIPDLYYPLLSSFLMLSLLVVTIYFKQELPLQVFTPSDILKLPTSPIAILKSLYGDSYTLSGAMSYSALSILTNIYLQVPRIILLALAPSVVSLFIILQSITGKIHFLSSTLGEITLNQSIRESLTNQITSFSRQYKFYKYAFMLLAAASLYVVIPRRDGSLLFFMSIFFLTYSSIISSESIFCFYDNVVKQRFLLNLISQFIATILVSLLLAFIYLYNLFFLISPYAILFAVSASILASQITMKSIYVRFSNDNQFLFK